jgi:ribosome-associated heat shock protein Hsp15
MDDVADDQCDALGGPESMRLDKWLYMVRFFKTRTAAAAAITGRGVRINGRKANRPAQGIRLGDVLTFAQSGTVRVVRVAGMPVRRGPATEAQACYDDLDAVSHDHNAVLEPPAPLA